jgi:hypothetical protein
MTGQPWSSRFGIKTIFIDSNQGEKFYENVSPDLLPSFRRYSHRAESIAVISKKRSHQAPPALIRQNHDPGGWLKCRGLEGLNLDLAERHIGQVQLSGRSSNGVPGGMPDLGSPRSGS